jgi:ribose transport system permease protein
VSASAGVTAGAAGETRARRRWTGARLAQAGLAAWAVVAVVVAGLTVAEPVRFWSAGNLSNVLTATVVLGLVALGQHLVVLSGGIDLSVGSMATLSCLLTAVLLNGYPIRTVPVVLGMLALGLVVGAVHGLLVGVARIPAFIVTLATSYLLQGAAFLVSTRPAGQVTSALATVGLQRVGPFPVALVVLALAVALVAFLLRRTVFGRNLFAIGGDTAAARANGVPVERTLVTAYAVGAALAAAAGVMLAARATVGSPTAGQGLELSAITVVVVGGTSLLGGRGTLTGTLGGVVLLALVGASVTLLQLPATITELVRGLVILAAAAIFVVRSKR